MIDTLKNVAAVLMVVLVVSVLLVGVIIGILGLTNTLDRTKCNQYGTETKREVKFAFWPVGKCYVNTDKGWYLLNQVRYTND